MLVHILAARLQIVQKNSVAGENNRIFGANMRISPVGSFTEIENI